MTGICRVPIILKEIEFEPLSGKGIEMECATALGQDALTETYQDVEKLICKTVWEFIESYGGDFQELQAEANFTFVKSYQSHQPSRSKFPTWLRNNIWYTLLNFKKGFMYPIRHNKKIEYVPFIHPESSFHEKDENWLTDLMDELGNDAIEIVNLFLDIPESVQEAAMDAGGSGDKIRSNMRRYAKENLGWTARRVRETFSEIKEAVHAY